MAHMVCTANQPSTTEATLATSCSGIRCSPSLTTKNSDTVEATTAPSITSRINGAGSSSSAARVLRNGTSIFRAARSVVTR